MPSTNGNGEPDTLYAVENIQTGHIEIEYHDRPEKTIHHVIYLKGTDTADGTVFHHMYATSPDLLAEIITKCLAVMSADSGHDGATLLRSWADQWEEVSEGLAEYEGAIEEEDEDT